MTEKVCDRKIKFALLVATPAFCYIIFELITGNLFAIHSEFIIWNLLFYYSFYLLLFGITNSIKISYLLLNSIFTFWAIAEYFVVGFRQRPIMIWDIIAWKTAMTVAENYQYNIVIRMVLAVIAMIIWNILIVKYPFKFKQKKNWLIMAAVSSVLCEVWLIIFYGFLIEQRKIDISMWNPKESYEQQGYMICTMRTFEYIRVKKPVDYSNEALERIEAQIQTIKEEINLAQNNLEQIVPTNIICIMNESWSDLSVIAPFRTDQEYLSYYHSLSENSIVGNLYVPVFGSMTSNTEYEFLTGNSMAFAPKGTVPFQIYLREPTYSLPLILKNQGYQVIAMHPYAGQNWNRVRAYQSMGFDAFLDEEYFTESEQIRGYVSDKSNYDKIIELTAQKAENQPLFIFNVTMQNHGGYDQEYDATVHLADDQNFPQTEQYLSLIRESDEALEYLLNYYREIEEPTLILMFGDHQPSVEEEFYQELYQQELSNLEPVDYARRYITPFVIWTNYPSTYEEVDQLSALYLSGLVMERANLKMTDYQYFLSATRKEVPVIHMLGYYNAHHKWQSWTNWRSKEEYPVLHQLELLQYHAMFDRKRVMEHLFINSVKN